MKKCHFILTIFLFLLFIMPCAAKEVTVWIDEHGETKWKYDEPYEEGTLTASKVREVYVWKDEQGNLRYSEAEPLNWFQMLYDPSQQVVTFDNFFSTQVDMIKRYVYLRKEMETALITFIPFVSRFELERQCEVIRNIRDDMNAIVNRLNNKLNPRHHGVLTQWVGRGLRLPAPRLRKVPAAETAGYMI